MSDQLQNSFREVDKDLATSWKDLASKVRTRAADLKLRTAGSDLSETTAKLAEEANALCDHVERIHSDVLDLIADLDERYPDSRENFSPDVSCDEVDKEKIQIQREQHKESSLKQVVKAMFMWVDDPVERVKEKKGTSKSG